MRRGSMRKGFKGSENFGALDGPLGSTLLPGFQRIGLPLRCWIYNYDSDWTPLLAGLSPAGMAVSLAARSISTELSYPHHVRTAPDSDPRADVPVRSDGH
jgi:hypothetical protein